MKMPRSGKPGRLRRHLSVSGIVKTIRTCFERLESPVPGRKPPLDDGLLSAPAMFKLKYPSPLHFETDACGEQDQPGFAPQPQDAFRHQVRLLLKPGMNFIIRVKEQDHENVNSRLAEKGMVI